MGQIFHTQHDILRALSMAPQGTLVVDIPKMASGRRLSNRIGNLLKFGRIERIGFDRRRWTLRMTEAGQQHLKYLDHLEAEADVRWAAYKALIEEAKKHAPIAEQDW